jgi:2'-5' RNA ligase
MRTFLAIELPDSLRTRLAGLQPAFADQGSLKWSSPALLHITVRFLGSVPAERIAEVEAAAREAAAEQAPFRLELAGLGAFPTERAPRVLWVGLAHDAGYDELQRLFGRAENALVARGFSREERAFAPHITLARARETASAAEKRSVAETLARLKQRAGVRGSWQVDALTVMRSELSRTGPSYTPLAVWPLGGG